MPDGAISIDTGLASFEAFARLLQDCEGTASRKAKDQFVADALAGEHGVDIAKLLTYVYSPFITFGVKALPDPIACAVPSPTIGMIYGMLDALASRELSGNAAAEAIAAVLGNIASAAIRDALCRLLRKDLRVGIDAKTVNKARPGLIPVFPYMRCSLPSHVDLGSMGWSDGVVSQEKADGMFANVDHTAAGEVRISSRQGTEFPLGQFGNLIASVQQIVVRDTQTHGELLVRRDGVVLAREISNGILNSIAKGGTLGEREDIAFLAWDQVPLSAVKPKGKYTTPYHVRLGSLISQIGPGEADAISPSIFLIPTRIVYSLEDAYAHYRELLSKGKEGTILKKREAIWRDGTSKEQVKLKLEVDVDLKIVGFVPGEGKNAATFGSILCRTEDDQLEVAVSGMSDAKRQEIHHDREQMLERILTVRANAIMPPSDSNPLHSLFLPRFVEVRNDKTKADDLARVKAQFASAISAA